MDRLLDLHRHRNHLPTMVIRHKGPDRHLKAQCLNSPVWPRHGYQSKEDTVNRALVLRRARRRIQTVTSLQVESVVCLDQRARVGARPSQPGLYMYTVKQWSNGVQNIQTLCCWYSRRSLCSLFLLLHVRLEALLISPHLLLFRKLLPEPVLVPSVIIIVLACTLLRGQPLCLSPFRLVCTFLISLIGDCIHLQQFSCRGNVGRGETQSSQGLAWTDGPAVWVVFPIGQSR